MHRWTLAPLFASLLLISQPSLAADGHAHAPAQGVAALSPELRAALAAEMAALQNGMMAAIPAIVAGHWEEVARIGAQMRDSYILAQTLTDGQRKELHETLPASFLELDARFHYLAGMLSHVADAKKPELVAFYLSTMTETCVSCHARHAQEKFPAFASEPSGHDHAH